MQACVAGQGTEALLGCQLEQESGQLDVVRFGQDLRAELQTLPACCREALQRLP